MDGSASNGVGAASHLTPLLRQALTHIPAEQRTTAAQAVTYLQAGYGDREAARALGISWKQLNELRDGVGLGVVSALRADGYSEAEIITYLGVATVMAATAARKT
jgi:hypothetical protein